MSRKKINIPTIGFRNAEQKLDEWVSGISTLTSPQTFPSKEDVLSEESSARFTVIMPMYLHRRMKKACVHEGISMKDKLVKILEKEFPEI